MPEALIYWGLGCGLEGQVVPRASAFIHQDIPQNGFEGSTKTLYLYSKHFKKLVLIWSSGKWTHSIAQKR